MEFEIKFVDGTLQLVPKTKTGILAITTTDYAQKFLINSINTTGSSPNQGASADPLKSNAGQIDTSTLLKMTEELAKLLNVLELWKKARNPGQINPTPLQTPLPTPSITNPNNYTDDLIAKMTMSEAMATGVLDKWRQLLDKKSTTGDWRSGVSKISGITNSIGQGLAQIGAATGNQGMMKAGMATSALGGIANMATNFKSLKGLQEGSDAYKAVKLDNMGNGFAMGGQAADLARGLFFGNLAANDSDTTSGLNMGYDAISNAAMCFGPVGQMVGGAMKAGALLGDAMQALGGGTDQMTSTDKIMDSSFLSWNVGLINGFGGSNADRFSVNRDTLKEVGSDYGGTSKFIQEAAELSGKKYGLFSSSARRAANEKMALARLFLNKMTNIADVARDLRLSASSMGQLSALNYQLNLNGGILDFSLSAKFGAKLTRVRNIGNNWSPILYDSWEPIMFEIVSEFKLGGTIENNDWTPTMFEQTLEFRLGGIIEIDCWEPILYEWEPVLFKKGGNIENPEDDEYKNFLESLPKNLQTEDSSYRMRRYWELNGKPKSFTESLTLELPMFIWDKLDKAYRASTIAWNENGEGEFMKSSKHPTIGEELKYYYSDDAKDFREKYDLDLSGEYWKYIPKQTKLFKEGGQLKEEEYSPLTDLKNIIPEGALHKNKHHMENAEGLTKKGIPVIDNDGEQLAEIELNEIIFSLEVTKKLESLYKSFYHYDTSNKEKDDLAIEAGQLLVLEILFNTDDRTGLIDTLKKGGTING